MSLCCLARIEAAQGRERDIREHVAEAMAWAEPRRVDSVLFQAWAALGILELGLGNLDEAVAHLESAAGITARDRVRVLGPAHWGPDLVEAYVRSGRMGDVRRALARFEDEERGGRGWARATLARCRGLLAGDDAFTAQFIAAFEWHDRTPAAFSRGRTELCFGERLRRVRRRREATVHLSAALAWWVPGGPARSRPASPPRSRSSSEVSCFRR